MAASFGQPALPASARRGSTISLESDRRELASETVITSIDAQSAATSVAALAYKTSEPQIPESPHDIFQPTVADMVNLKAASAEVNHGFASLSHDGSVPTPQLSGETTLHTVAPDVSLALSRWGWGRLSLDFLPNEILMQILGFLDVSDLLITSRVSHWTCLYMRH